MVKRVVVGQSAMINVRNLRVSGRAKACELYSNISRNVRWQGSRPFPKLMAGLEGCVVHAVIAALHLSESGVSCALWGDEGADSLIERQDAMVVWDCSSELVLLSDEELGLIRELKDLFPKTP